MLKKLAPVVVAFLLSGCVVMPDSGTGGMYQPREISSGLFMFSEQDMPLGSFGGGMMERAARFCDARGQRMQIQGSGSDEGAWSGRRYENVVFTCEDVSGSQQSKAED